MTAVLAIALRRGGFNAYGRSSFDPRLDAIIVRAEPGQNVPCKATFHETINTVTYETTGVTTTEPVISSASMTFTLSNFQEGSRIRYDVLLSTGETRALHVIIQGARASAFPSQSDDYGTFA